MRRLAAALAVLLTGSIVPGAAAEPVGVLAVPPAPQPAGTVASGLAAPWGLAFLPDGSALVSERNT